MSETFLHGIEVVEIDDGIRPIQTVRSSLIGIVGTAPAAHADDFPLNVPVLLSGPRAALALGATGTLLADYNAIYAQGVSIAVVVRVAEGVDDDATRANVLGAAAEQTGVWALLTAPAVLGLTPRIIAAPGWTMPSVYNVKQPVTDALVSIAARLRAVVVADGPNTTEANAVAYRANYGSDRLYIVDPGVRVVDTVTDDIVTRSASAYVAGLISATDARRGFWWSPSNQELSGIVGTARPIQFAISDPDTEANRLNEVEVATIVRQDGFRLWGNRSTAADPLWAFLSIRRTADMVYESVENAMLWAMDRPFSEQLLRDIRDTVQAYLNTLRARGAILGGRVWVDPELNTEAELRAGKLSVDFDIEPAAPLERLTFRARRNGAYYDELVTAVAITN